MPPRERAGGWRSASSATGSAVVEPTPWCSPNRPIAGVYEESWSPSIACPDLPEALRVVEHEADDGVVECLRVPEADVCARRLPNGNPMTLGEGCQRGVDAPEHLGSTTGWLHAAEEEATSVCAVDGRDEVWQQEMKGLRVRDKGCVRGCDAGCPGKLGEPSRHGSGVLLSQVTNAHPPQVVDFLQVGWPWRSSCRGPSLLS
jgi:hypothetical protein